MTCHALDCIGFLSVGRVHGLSPFVYKMITRVYWILFPGSEAGMTCFVRRNDDVRGGNDEKNHDFTLFCVWGCHFSYKLAIK